ncbi:hypothetical protein [Actinomadura parmotrematis]|uniref:DUF1772 domain-containing protein n=1 Tax=Actinomadura parmotrematis TaxID=2864039 RepID=A0ABS7FPA2_9ACTN|nr:hypothetical protein [Actinomadura parmotrematis]MBW8482191.1 hypothetical protein [Actinomadura parmotrematis]
MSSAPLYVFAAAAIVLGAAQLAWPDALARRSGPFGGRPGDEEVRLRRPMLRAVGALMVVGGAVALLVASGVLEGGYRLAGLGPVVLGLAVAGANRRVAEVQALQMRRTSPRWAKPGDETYWRRTQILLRCVAVFVGGAMAVLGVLALLGVIGPEG